MSDRYGPGSTPEGMMESIDSLEAEVDTLRAALKAEQAFRRARELRRSLECAPYDEEDDTKLIFAAFERIRTETIEACVKEVAGTIDGAYLVKRLRALLRGCRHY